MKNIIILATILLGLCACKNENKETAMPMPSTFMELVDGIDSLGGDVHVGITSHDSLKTDYRYYCSIGFFGMEEPCVNKENPSYKDIMEDIERRATKDSTTNANLVRYKYLKAAINHLKELYRHDALSFNDYEMHKDGLDSAEIAIELKTSVDENGNTLEGEYFNWQSGNKYGLNSIFSYRKSEPCDKKKAACEEDIQKIILDYISKYKNVQSTPVKYHLDADFECEPQHDFWPYKNTSYEVTQEGKIYKIPVTGKNRVKPLEEIRNLLKEYMNSHYAKYLYCSYANKFDIEDSKQYDGNLITITFFKDSQSNGKDDGTYHVEIGYGEKGVYILCTKSNNKGLIYVCGWMNIKEVYNDNYTAFPDGWYK